MQLRYLYLIRHAESEGNAHFEKGLGRLPPTELGSKLTEIGVSQAYELARDLELVDFAAIYSSDLQRAHQTAGILALGRSKDIVLLPELRERLEGEETDAEATSRFVTAMDLLRDSYSEQAIAVVTHGFVIRAFLDHIGVKNMIEMPHGFVQNAGYLKLALLGDEYKLIETKRVGGVVTT